MARWLVELQGEPFDLEEFPHWFPPGGDVYAIREGAKVLLGAPAMDQFDQPEQAQELAESLLDELYATIRLVQAGVRRPTTGTIWHEDNNGGRRGFALMSAHLSGRAKLRGFLGPDPQPSYRTRAQLLLETARADRHLHVAMSILALPHATWPHLYRCVEEVEHSLKAGVVEAGLCQRPALVRFRRTVNTGETGGLNARHRLGHAEPPLNPMTLSEATGFVTQLVLEALDRLAKRNAA